MADSGISLSQTLTVPPGVTCTGLAITPGSSTLTVTQMSPVSPSSATFTAALTPPGCVGGTFAPLWSVDRVDLAQISAGTAEALVDLPAATAYGVGTASTTVSAWTALNNWRQTYDCISDE